MSEKLKVGIIGVGNFGKTHLSILQSFENVELVAVADIDQAKVNEFKQLGNVKRTYMSASELVKDPEVEMVDIVSPEDHHGEQVEMALNQGKHVFVEKPLSTAAKHAQKLAQLAEEKGLKVMAGNAISRFSQPYYLLKKNQGKMGEIATIRSKRNLSRAWFEAYGYRIHPVFESGIHDIDLAVWLAESKCKRVYAVERKVTNYPVPDGFVALLEFENGIVAQLESSWLVPDNSPKTSIDGFLKGTLDIECEVIGTKQTAKIDLTNTGLSIWAKDEVMHPEYSIWTEEFGQFGGALRKMLEYFVNELYTLKSDGYVKLEETVHGLEVAEAILKSASEKQSVLL